MTRQLTMGLYEFQMVPINYTKSGNKEDAVCVALTFISKVGDSKDKKESEQEAARGNLCFTYSSELIVLCDFEGRRLTQNTAAKVFFDNLELDGKTSTLEDE